MCGVGNIVKWFWWWQLSSGCVDENCQMILIKIIIPMVPDDGIFEKELNITSLINQIYEVPIESIEHFLIRQMDLKLWSWSFKTWRCKNVKAPLIKLLLSYLSFDYFIVKETRVNLEVLTQSTYTYIKYFKLLLSFDKDS